MQTISLKNDILLRRKDIMQLLRIKSEKTYYKIMRQSKIKGIRLGGFLYFLQSDIEEYLNSQKKVII